MFVASSTFPLKLTGVRPVAPAFFVGGVISPFAPVLSWEQSRETVFDRNGNATGTVVDLIPIASNPVTEEGSIAPPISVLVAIQIPVPDDIVAVTQINVGGQYYELVTSPVTSETVNAVIPLTGSEGAVRERFRLGSSVNLFGIPFRVTQLQIVRSLSHVYPNHKISVTVSLEWYLSETFKDSPLNKPPAVPSSVSTAKGKVEAPSKTKRVDVFTVVARQPGQLKVVGSAVVAREVPTSGKPAVVDTANYSSVGEALADGAAKNGSFLYRSGEAIATRQWGQVPTHFISPAEITTDLTFVLQSSDGDIKDSSSSDEEEEDEEEEKSPPPDRDKEEIVETERFEFENCLNDVELTLPYYDYDDAVRTANICYDAGGPTKKKRIIEEKGGVMLETTEQVWGYAFISKDVHAYYPDRNPPDIEFLPSLVNMGWQKVQETTTRNYFDELGYLVKTEVSGYKLARFQQESELETASLYLEALIYGLDTEDGQRNLTEIESYQFDRKLPLYDVTTYSLSSMLDYYRDIIKPTGDPFWIEPKFAAVATRKQVDRALAPNPRSDDTVKLPPIILVQELIEETKTVITNTKCTPERFCVIQYSNAAEGTGGKNRIVVISNQENLGRPSTHTNLPQKQIFWQDLIDLPKESEDEKTEQEREEKEEKAKEIFEQTIAATRDETLSFSMLYRPEFNEGDKVYFDGRYWVILDISAEFICQMGRVNCEDFKLTLGRLT
jgi:hypothetical protein